MKFFGDKWVMLIGNVNVTKMHPLTKNNNHNYLPRNKLSNIMTLNRFYYCNTYIKTDNEIVQTDRKKYFFPENTG